MSYMFWVICRRSVKKDSNWQINISITLEVPYQFSLICIWHTIIGRHKSHMWSVERAREDAAMCRKRKKKTHHVYIGIGVEAPLCVKHKINFWSSGTVQKTCTIWQLMPCLTTGNKVMRGADSFYCLSTYSQTIFVVCFGLTVLQTC